MTQIYPMNLRHLAGYFGSEIIQHGTRKRNAETDGHTSYIGKVDLKKSLSYFPRLFINTSKPSC